MRLVLLEVEEAERGEVRHHFVGERGDLVARHGEGCQPGQLQHLKGSGFRVQGSGFRVQGSGFRVQGSGSGLRVEG